MGLTKHVHGKNGENCNHLPMMWSVYSVDRTHQWYRGPGRCYPELYREATGRQSVPVRIKNKIQLQIVSP